MVAKQQKTNIKVSLFGASLNSGNLGVGALSESSIKVILNRWPDADITLVGSGYEPRQHHFSFWGKDIRVKSLPIRYSTNPFLPYHFLSFAFYSLLLKVLPGVWAKKALLKRNPHARSFFEMDLAVDITGGDSFSDIYGFRRFFLGFLRKWLIIFSGKRLVLLPQTYGPFRRRLTRVMARYILRRANVIHSRDRAGVESVNKLLNNSENEKVRFSPDVAFVLDPQRPASADMSSLSDMLKDRLIIVGLNVSGLLYNGCYARNNTFGLKEDYRQTTARIIDSLMARDDIIVLLVPHVFTPIGNFESDVAACRDVYNKLPAKNRDRVFVVSGSYGPGQIKYIIGWCDLFLGSRMHACIAALSQSIPAIGLAYSKKFRGVFESVGAEELVIDTRKCRQDEILTAIDNAFEKREAIAERLRRTIPGAQARILNMFRDFEL